MFDFVTLSCATNILTELNVNLRERCTQADYLKGKGC